MTVPSDSTCQDVVRTDRDSRRFVTGGFTAQLLDVLVSFAVFDPAFAYTQGMTDMLSPILVVMNDEVCSSRIVIALFLTRMQALAFWMFSSLMGRFRSHFDPSGTAIHERLASARGLIMLMQPDVFHMLAEYDLLPMFYCYRWVLLHFKREFPLMEVCRCPHDNARSQTLSGDADMGDYLGGPPLAQL